MIAICAREKARETVQCDGDDGVCGVAALVHGFEHVPCMHGLE
jgi:hypothetical protein